MTSPIQTKTINVDGVEIRYAEGGSGPHQALLLSPRPESIYAFESVWPQLTQVAHVVAVDLPGFGASEGLLF